MIFKIVKMKFVIFFLMCVWIQTIGSLTDLHGILEVSRVQARGGEVLLSCSSNTPVQSVRWLCNACFGTSKFKEVTLATKEGVIRNSEFPTDRIQIVRVGNSYSLNIKEGRVTDSGKYFCLINNSAVPLSTINLAIQDVPSSPGKPLIMSFDSRSVVLSWTPPPRDNHAPVTHYSIQILEGEHSDWSRYQSISTQNADLRYKVPNLKPFTVYSYRVVAINRMGASEPSEPSYMMQTARELPTGKVRISEAYSGSPDSIFVSWLPIYTEKIHGEFLGYRVFWKSREKENETPQQADIKNPNQTKISLSNLNPYTAYVISIQVLNPLGSGPSNTVLVTTKQGVPSSPANLSVTSVSQTDISLSWYKPHKSNGKIIGYRIYYNHGRDADIYTVNTSSDYNIYNISHLVPFTRYEITVAAVTASLEGQRSQPLQIMTDVAGPGTPDITNLSCPQDNSVFIQWKHPKAYYKSVDKYKIYYKIRESGEAWRILDMAVNQSLPEFYRTKMANKVLLTDLKIGSEYNIFIQALSRSIYNKNIYFPGLSTDILTITPGRECTRVQVAQMTEEESGSNVLLACLMGTLTVILLLLLISFTIICRRKLHSRKEHCVIRRHVHGNTTASDDLSLGSDARSSESGVGGRPGSDNGQKIPLFHVNSYSPLSAEIPETWGCMSQETSVQSFWDSGTQTTDLNITPPPPLSAPMCRRGDMGGVPQSHSMEHPATSQWVFSSSMAAGGPAANGAVGGDPSSGGARLQNGGSISVVGVARPPMLRSETFHLMGLSGGGPAASNRPESWPQQVPETRNSSQQQMPQSAASHKYRPNRNSIHDGSNAVNHINSGVWMDKRVLVNPRFQSNGHIASNTLTLPRSISYHTAARSDNSRNQDLFQRRLSTFNRQDRHSVHIPHQSALPVFYSPQYQREPWPRHIVDIPLNSELGLPLDTELVIREDNINSPIKHLPSHVTFNDSQQFKQDDDNSSTTTTTLLDQELQQQPKQQPLEVNSENRTIVISPPSSSSKSTEETGLLSTTDSDNSENVTAKPLKPLKITKTLETDI